MKQKALPEMTSRLINEAGVPKGKAEEINKALNEIQNKNARINVDWKNIQKIEKVLWEAGYTGRHLEGSKGECILFVSANLPLLLDRGEHLEDGVLKFTDLIGKMKKPINYFALTDSPVTYIGEDHMFDSQREEFLKVIGGSGAKIVALEALPSPDQGYVDGYLGGKNDGKKMIKYLEGRFGESWPSYMKIIDYCKENKISILALEIPSRGTLDSGMLEENGKPPNENNFLSGRRKGKDFDARNEHWIKLIKQKQMENPGQKILVFSGGSHTWPLHKIYPSEVPPLELRVISDIHQAPRKKFGDARDGQVGLNLPEQLLTVYQHRTGETDFVVNIDGTNWVVRGTVR